MTDARHAERPVAGIIRIKNWKKFQNYKFRNPPWIRLYGDLLDTEETPWYRGLTDNGARFLFEIWLLARRDKGVVPYDTLMILRDLHRPTSDKPLLDMALTELASVGAITIAGADASAAFLNTLAHRGTELQSFRASVPSEPATAAQQQQPTGNGSLPPETPNPFKVLFPLIRESLWRPDGKCPTEIAGKPWTEDQEGTVIRELAKAYSVSDLETIILGLGFMLRGLAESERPDWLEVGGKASLRAVYKSRSGVVQMVEHCRRAFWSVENKRPKKPRAAGPTAVGELLGGALP